MGHQSRQLSTHDMINMNGPIIESPNKTSVKPNQLKKGDSMWNGLLGDGDANTKHDEFGLNELTNPTENNLFEFDTHPTAKDNKSDGDIFSGMFNSNEPKTESKSLFGGMFDDKPAQQQKNDDSKSMHDDMMKNFNKPSYGGGHNNNNNKNATKLNNSQTHKVPKNGASAHATTAHINNKDLSQKDKAQMVKMKLSNKGAQKANEAYNKAMADRQKEEEAAKQRLKEIAYWKEKHEHKLNEWEYKDTVRRNIRTLIGKMPNVLPPDLKWKPIPMTKLLDDTQLKKGYYKAVRVVHPDKSIGRKDPIETQVICDHVFQALEQAYNKHFG